MKKAFLIVFLGLLTSAPLASLAAGLVPCGGPGQSACQLCHIFVLLQNIINFLMIPSPNNLFPLVLVIAVLMIAVGGIYLLFSGGSPSSIAKGRSIITSVLIALLIIYGAWLLVNFFFLFVGVNDWTGLFPKQNTTGEWTSGWFQIKNCPLTP